MTADERAISPDAVTRTNVKLQAFYNALSEDEQQVVQVLIHRAAGDDEVAGYGRFDFPITIKAKTVTVSPSDGGGSGTNPNKGKDGTTIASQPGGTPGGGATTVGISIRF